MVVNAKPTLVKSYLPKPCGDEIYGKVYPTKGQLFIAYPYGYFIEGSIPFIEVKENGKTVQTIAIDTIAEIHYDLTQHGTFYITFKHGTNIPFKYGTITEDKCVKVYAHSELQARARLYDMYPNFKDHIDKVVQINFSEFLIATVILPAEDQEYQEPPPF